MSKDTRAPYTEIQLDGRACTECGEPFAPGTSSTPAGIAYCTLPQCSPDCYGHQLFTHTEPCATVGSNGLTVERRPTIGGELVEITAYGILLTTMYDPSDTEVDAWMAHFKRLGVDWGRFAALTYRARTIGYRNIEPGSRSSTLWILRRRHDGGGDLCYTLDEVAEQITRAEERLGLHAEPR